MMFLRYARFWYALSALGVPLTGLATTYTLTDLGSNTAAYGINSSKVIVGLQVVSGSNEPVYWSSGVMHSVPTPGTAGVAMSINTNNVLTGTYMSNTYPNDYAYTFTIGGSSVTTESFNGAAFGYGINDSGYTTAWSAADQRIYSSYVGLINAPDSGGMQTDILADPNGTGDCGNNINSTGYVTGVVKNTVPGNSGTNGFFVTNSSSASGNGSNLGTGTAVNSSGHCCLESATSPAYAQFYDGSTLTAIGSTSTASTASGINASDQVVGSSGGHAYVWTSSGGVTDLNSVTTLPTGWTLTVARAINDNGYIVGRANVTTIGSRGPSTVVHGFMLSPSSGNNPLLACIQ